MIEIKKRKNGLSTYVIKDSDLYCHYSPRRKPGRFIKFDIIDNIELTI
jgi:hypothetical protein